MLDDPKLLVVDDEEVICEGCRRIFSRQGFEVEKCSDACQGLTLAKQNDYSAILLDIKMPTMDGIAFLEALRKQKADVPVVLMTGYPSIPNAASAIRLGASDYVTKPFTPEEITQAVHRLLHHDTTPSRPQVAAASRTVGPGRAVPLLASCLVPAGRSAGDAGRRRAHGSHDLQDRSGPLAADRRGGLSGPAAGRRDCGRQAPAVHSRALSGVVVAVNEALKQDPALLLSDPCGKGWIACISATRAEDEAAACLSRRVTLYNPDLPPRRPRPPSCGPWL